MEISDFCGNSHVIHELDDLRAYLEKSKLNVSDIRDKNGLQYVDLVQEGGGVLGISLLGFTYALEEIGIRFLSMAGTSAGAINTVLLAACDVPSAKKSKRLISIIAETDFNDFLDGGEDVHAYLKSLINENKLQSILALPRFIDDFALRNELGLNRGSSFYHWVESSLNKMGVYDSETLVRRMNSFPSELNRDENIYADLAIIACDITTQTKAIFPRMSKFYFSNPDKIHPAKYVRASMSIPLFFDPVIFEEIPKGVDQLRLWKQEVDYSGDIPDSIVFVDGGVLSNFPIDVFHRYDKIPNRPTFGVKLGLDRIKSFETHNIAEVFINSFNAARQMRDFEVLMRNKDFKNIISYIDNAGINWLNFNLTNDEKIELFNQGVSSACRFIKDFDWHTYKNIRESMIVK